MVMASETAIARSAAEELRRMLQTIVRNFHCELIGGIAVLQGQARSYYHKQLAQEAARQLRGVRRVVNRIDVLYPRRA